MPDTPNAIPAQPAIEGYAAVYYDGSPRTEYLLGVDPWTGQDVIERIMPGAFARALDEGRDVLATFNHMADQVLGRTGSGTLTLRETDKGLRYRVETAPTRAGQIVAEAVARGDVTGSSFSFREAAADWVDEGDVIARQVVEADVLDVGPVTYPAYAATTARLARAKAWRKAAAAAAA